MWILEARWRLVDDRVSACRDIAKYQSVIQSLRRAIVERLKVDRRHWAEESGEAVEKLLGSDPPLHREAWHRLKGWYQTAVDRSTPPNRLTLERITAELVDLYSYVPPPGDNISVSVDPFPVDDLVPTEEKIEWAVT